MAGAWIHFDVETPRKPEIVTLALRCARDRFWATGCAMAIWSYASEHFAEPTLTGMTLESLAEVVGVPLEFCRGMVAVGWLLEVDGGLQLPNAQWITKSGKARLLAAKRNADLRDRRTDRPAERHAQRNGSVTRSVTAASRGASPKEQNRREENSNSITPLTPLGGNPLVVPEAFRTGEVQDAIERWRAYRAEAKLRAWKPTTWAAQFGKLTPERFIAAVNHSIAHGYQGLYEPKENSNGNRPGKILAGAGQVHDADRQRAVGQF